MNHWYLLPGPNSSDLDWFLCAQSWGIQSSGPIFWGNFVVRTKFPMDQIHCDRTTKAGCYFLVIWCLLVTLPLPLFSTLWRVKAQPLSCDAIYSSDSPPPNVYPVIFEELNAQWIRSAALQTAGAGGPSGTDALSWRRLCTSFKWSSDELCYSLSHVAKKLCSSFVDPEGLSALLACRLVALDKNPGVRPIGICETVWCIIAKAALQLTWQDIQEAASSLQLCAGQPSRVEADLHAVRTTFEDTSCDCVLKVDATNAFNSLNRLSALHNILHTCPALAKIIINCYRSASYLFVCGSELKSEEGTTQGDPLAMPFYALATLPLIKELSSQCSVIYAWYADDVTTTFVSQRIIIGTTTEYWWDIDIYVTDRFATASPI